MAYQEINNLLLIPGAILDSVLLIQMNENSKAVRVDSVENRKGRVLKSARYTDTATRSFGTGEGTGYTIPNFVRVKSGSESRIKVEFRLPARNDSGSWGGCYNRIEYTTDNGTNWHNAGDGGFDGAVMGTGASISSDTGVVWFDNLSGDQFQMRFKHHSYDGTVSINGSHNINSGDQNWGWTNIYIEEISI